MQSVLFGLLVMLLGGLYDFTASILAKRIGDKAAVLGVLGTSALVTLAYCLVTRQPLNPQTLLPPVDTNGSRTGCWLLSV